MKIRWTEIKYKIEDVWVHKISKMYSRIIIKLKVIKY